MIELKDLLGRFSKLLSTEEFKKDAIKKTLKEAVGVEVSSEDIEIKGDTVYLNLKPIYKSEILVKADKIQSLLEESLGKRSPHGFR